MCKMHTHTQTHPYIYTLTHTTFFSSFFLVLHYPVGKLGSPYLALYQVSYPTFQAEHPVTTLPPSRQVIPILQNNHHRSSVKQTSLMTAWVHSSCKNQRQFSAGKDW